MSPWLWMWACSGAGGDSGAQTEMVAPIADTSAMAEISGGTFIMGHPDDPMGDYGNSWKENELPPHEVTISTFWLDIDEATVADWAAFLSSLGDAAQSHHHPLQPVVGSVGTFEPAEGMADRPIGTVSWYDAVVYCAWVGKRLPTEAEWERASKGLDDEDQGYPWGTTSPTCAEAVYFTHRTLCADAPEPVGSRSPGGDSPDGVHDLAGNVAEWVWDGYDRYPEDPQIDPQGPEDTDYRVLRGGGFRDTRDGLRSMARIAADPASRSEGVGFRCAVTL